MHNLEIFNHQEFGQLRMLMIDEIPWFAAVDVCMALDVQNVTQAITRLDEDERSMFNIGRQGETNFVNEYGLYSLVLGSRKPEAKAFKRWITHEVIPSIRKTGSYSVKRTENSENVYLKAAQILSRCTAANRPYVLAMLEAGGIKVDVAEERPKAKELPAAPKKERRGETIYGMSHERDVLFALWNCELPLKELAGVTGIPLETLRSYYLAKTIPTERHIGLLKESLKCLIDNKVGA